MDKNINSRDIAIIGMACRFPDADNYSEFWNNLIQNKNSIIHFSEEELLQKGRDKKTINSPNFVKAASVIKDLDKFDASFFNCNTHEAILMDPQIRLFLECAWEALENSGYATGDNSCKIGIYAGSNISNYLYRYVIQKIHETIDKEDISYNLNKCINDYMATFVAYKLNLRGPSFNVQNWCTSSTTAVHLACQSLRSKECDIILAGGVNLHIPQEGYFTAEHGQLSLDGSSSSFDKNARGTIPGNGLGIVVLKLLSKAVEDGDYIHAVIKGTSCNNDGFGPQKLSYHGLTTEGMCRAINDALVDSGVDAGSISHIEAHGTANRLADRVELNALSNTFKKYTDKEKYCAVTSVKSNIGHLGMASGIAGIIKVALSLKNKKIPGVINLDSVDKKTLNEHSPFYINTSLIDWESQNLPRRAAVNNFGLGGTNTHFILEEAPELIISNGSDKLEILTLSAQTASALEQIKLNLSKDLESYPEKSVDNVVYSMNIGRKAFNYRQSFVCKDKKSLVKSLNSKDLSHTIFNENEESSIVFLLSGSEDYRDNITYEFYKNIPSFKKEIDNCFDLLNRLYKIDIKSILYSDNKNVEKTDLNSTLIYLFVEYALAKVWIGWGVNPDLMIGCSTGELAAACIAEVISLQDAIKLIVELFNKLESLPSGKMLTVLCSKEEIIDQLNDDLSLAAVYNPSTLLLAGTTHATQEMMKFLETKNISYQLVDCRYPFHHSKYFDSLKDDISAVIKTFNISSPKISYISCVTKNEISIDTLKNPEYWLQIFSDTFDFNDAIKYISKTNTKKIYVEIGLKQTLYSMLKQHPSLNSNDVVFFSFSPSEDKDSELFSLYNTLGSLWQNGAKIDWKSFYRDEKRNRIPLPTYPFERKRYWYEIEQTKETEIDNEDSLIPKNKLSEWFYIPTWKQSYQFSGNIQTELAGAPKIWMVFIDGQNVGNKIVEKLEGFGQKVIIIRQGDGFKQTKTTEFYINPNSKSDYQALFSRLSEISLIPEKIVHLWSLESVTNNSDTGEINSDYLKLHFFNLIYIIQAIGETKKASEFQLFVLTSNLFIVNGDEQISPEKSVILGPIKTTPKEYKNIKCSCIEICSNKLNDSLLENLLNDFTNVPNENYIAYRGTQRWEQTYEKISLTSTIANANILRNKGTYLITGGLGGVGLVFSEYLAKNYNANLILVSRSKFPSRSEWDIYVKKADTNPNTVNAIKTIIELETKYGVTVLVCKGDVSNFNELSDVASLCKEKFGHINGIIHNAAVQGGGSIQFKSPEEIKEVFPPKIQGTTNLYEIFKNDDLDFLIFSSSIASVLGLYGLADYCSANAYVDAFAQKHFSNSRTLITAINWDMWSEVGMGISAKLPSDITSLREINKEFGIKSEEGIELLKQILSLKVPQTIISTREYSKLNQTKIYGSLWNEKIESTEIHSNQPSIISDKRTDYASNEIESILMGMWTKLFGTNEISIHDDFIKIGGHSLLATMLLNRIRNIFDDIEISLQDLFDNLTIEKMTRLIKGLLDERKAILASELQSGTDNSPVLQEIGQYLRDKISHALNINIEKNTDVCFEDIDIKSVTGQLYLDLKRDFNLPVYEFEILSKKSINELAIYIEESISILNNENKKEEVQKSVFTENFDAKNFSDDKIKSKNKSMAFVYSAVRSGSTLMRLILAGNSNLFSPPEMKILMYNTVKEWAEARHKHTILHGGVLRSFIELFGYSQKEALEYLNSLIEKDTPVSEVYRIIQDKLGARMLVDKSPEYSSSQVILNRAEKIFENPKYIFLIRHPYSVIDSIVRNRTYTMHMQKVTDPYKVAEETWYAFNSNLLNFFNSINSEKFMLVRYEDLVQSPKPIITNICDFLEIDFEEDMLYPYKGKRMIDGDGDPNIFNHDDINPELADVWRNIQLPIQLSEETKLLAGKFNYELPFDALDSNRSIEKIEINNH
ncbi:MAG: SDR family NAD(P)-dependent oxidoreductase [Bacteroidales bacterium]|nr:SDR family NAD(P)-dependent oxidoreductase [Bacteroidales bacterium]